MGGLRSNFVRLLIVGGIVSSPFVLWSLTESRHGNDEDAVQALSAGAPPSPAAAAATPEMLSLQDSFIRIAGQVRPAVVNISTVFEEKTTSSQYEFHFGTPFEDFFDDFFSAPKKNERPKERPAPHKYEGTGSGVIIDPRGYILTNEHVIHGAREIRVTLADEKRYKGKVVGKDTRTDIAIIKIRAGKDLPFARLGDSTHTRVGEWAIAIGSPFGLEATVTTGVISAVRQSLLIEGKDYRDLIQTDAAINRGNSGGPLLNIRGEVIGVNTAIYAPTGVFAGIGFAIPINSARDILADLIEKGRVVRGWLGVEIRAVDQAVAAQFSLPDTDGVLINNVMKGSPAEKAGLQRGDIVRSIDGKSITDVRSLQTMIAQTPPKTTVALGVMRDGTALVVSLTAGQMPADDDDEPVPADDAGAEPAAQEIASADWEGLKAVTMNETVARQFELPQAEKGCIVLSVEQGSIAEEAGLLPGDLIRAVNRAPTPGILELRAALRKVVLAQGIVFDVNRQGKLLFLSYTGTGR